MLGPEAVCLRRERRGGALDGDRLVVERWRGRWSQGRYDADLGRKSELGLGEKALSRLCIDGVEGDILGSLSWPATTKSPPMDSSSGSVDFSGVSTPTSIFVKFPYGSICSFQYWDSGGS